MRRAANVDCNQPEIVAALRGAGASVQLLHAVGCGCPDLLVGFRGENYLLEVKDGEKPPSERLLTAAQEKWHATWRGRKTIVRSVAEAFDAIGIFVARPGESEFLSPVFCEHANESGARCRCPPNCYCMANTCRAKAAIPRSIPRSRRRR